MNRRQSNNVNGQCNPALLDRCSRLGRALTNLSIAFAIVSLMGCGGGGSSGTTPSQISASLATVSKPGSVTVSPAGNPGLRNGDGTTHARPAQNVAPTIINVVKRASELGYKIDLVDSINDDRPGIEAVLRDASTVSGCTVYFPDGTYNLLSASSSQANANIVVTKNYVNLKGQSRDGTILKSSFDDGGTSTYFGVVLSGVHDVVFRNFTITSTWSRNYSSATDVNNPDAGGLTYALGVNYASSRGAAYNIIIDSVVVEKFRIVGARIGPGAHDVVVQNAFARNATDLGGGGSGYGFVAQGGGHVDAASNPYLGDSSKDTYFVVFDGNKTDGSYIRHGLLLQYWTHNNLVTSNTFVGTQLDSIDLHGEDEYANEIAYNTVIMARRAGIGLGNGGATHDKTGVYNWLHHNDLVNCGQGITVQYGTDYTTIENNTIRDNTSGALSPLAGIVLGKSNGSLVRANTFTNNTVAGFSAILLQDDTAAGTEQAGGPSNWFFTGNVVTSSGVPFVNGASLGAGNTIQTSW